MAISRKRSRELKKLQGKAESLWREQREVLDHANVVVREASRQLGKLTQEEVTPRVREAYDHRVRPVIATGIAAGRTVADGARRGAKQGFGSAVSGALGSALAVIEVAKDPKFRAAALRGKQKRGKGVLAFFGIALGILAAAGVGYAVWQTLRADDELWVEAEELGATATEASATV
ncbi:DNA helicase [Ruicaihuangia caeni]|uniref:DNA helicase n=1 Tax=Ruicaihuangia caeni TaxID=3042517 RepID=A0AAW6T6M4_9MICO|nr:DNA helicase [Klugiella sp. YN-L-19]MDI2099149.1 DNA helicase [Klugiella sp. YN-L-19]